MFHLSNLNTFSARLIHLWWLFRANHSLCFPGTDVGLPHSWTESFVGMLFFWFWEDSLFSLPSSMCLQCTPPLTACPLGMRFMRTTFFCSFHSTLVSEELNFPHFCLPPWGYKNRAHELRHYSVKKRRTFYLEGMSHISIYLRLLYTRQHSAIFKTALFIVVLVFMLFNFYFEDHYPRGSLKLRKQNLTNRRVWLSVNLNINYWRHYLGVN